jgi:hypothetical protein
MVSLCMRPNEPEVLKLGQSKSTLCFQDKVSSKNQTNEFYFTTMKAKDDLFSFVFWKQLKTPKRLFEIN